MSKKKLFNDDSDEDIDLKTENDYAKKYDSWREKEELHKLEQKYGPDVLKTDGVESSDSEDDSDEPLEVSPEVEEQFLKTLALLKTKDPRIYDPNFKCFNQEEEKKIEEKSKPKGLTFDDSDDDDDDGGDIFKIEKKAEIDVDDTQKEVKQAPKKKKEKKIKEYLTGKAEHIDDEVEKDLAPLKALWSDPKLNEGEAFLRDYILNKRYLEDDDEAGEGVAKLRDDADLEADEQTVEEQSKFERAYNFRFEEPDDEYLKRFPRTMNSVRPKDDRRSRKRAEVRARKEDEKKRKMEEIARLKAFKLKEIQEKIAKIKEVTGNDELAFKEEDIEGDFDPEEHDRRMKALFDDQYYGEADGEKPVFPDLDEELEIENWDNYDVDAEQQDARNEDGPHCEDEDFNMDADYDPQRPRADLLQEIQRNLGKKKRARKRKSRLASLLAADKPAYVPARDASYARFMDEYYAMDCEDVVGGDLPTRFKYRQVLPNDYGLTVEEILMADDRELTQWVPLKRVLKQRAAAAERGERAQYARRAADRRLKRRLLPSLYRHLPEEPELAVPVEEGSKKKKKKKNNTEDAEDFNEDEVPGQKEGELQPEVKQKKKKNKEKNSENIDHINNHQQSDFEINEQKDVNEVTSEVKHTKKKRRKNKSNDESNSELERVEKRDGIISRDDNLNSSIEARSKKNNENSKTTNDSSVKEYNNIEESPNKITTTEIKNNKKKKKRNQSGINGDSNNSIIRSSIGVNRNVAETKKKQRADSFVVEDVSTQGPSQESSLSNNANNRSKINNKNEHSPGKAQKRKSETQIDSIQQKKRKHNVINMSKGKKDLKTKLKQKNKFKNKNNSKKKNNTASENPLNKLSDERLKAYGLNPKKYKNFLKYKKF